MLELEMLPPPQNIRTQKPQTSPSIWKGVYIFSSIIPRGFNFLSLAKPIQISHLPSLAVRINIIFSLGTCALFIFNLPPRSSAFNNRYWDNTVKFAIFVGIWEVHLFFPCRVIRIQVKQLVKMVGLKFTP